MALNLENADVRNNKSVIPNKGYPFGTMVSILCKCGYSPSELQLSLCQSFGNWSLEPICSQGHKIILINLAFICTLFISTVNNVKS